MRNENELRIVINAKDAASAVLARVGESVKRASKHADDLGSRLKPVNERFKRAAQIMGDDFMPAIRKIDEGMSRVTRRVTIAATVIGTTLAGAAIKAAKASWDQVRQVENASFALRAYEKDAGKVQQVLGELVKYARSDMGVLFQRQDLFDAASTLKMYGAETDSLVGKVQILSKGVAQGKTTFQELSQIVGRAAAKGRLDAVDFDMLIERGIGLDRSFRGAKVTSEQLYKALDKALPDEILANRAKSIDGTMIRLQSAFRDLGGVILRVDKDTSTFIEGGLGDKMMKALDRFRQWMRDAAPDIQLVVDKVMAFGESAALHLGPKVQELWRVFTEQLLPALQELVGSITGQEGIIESMGWLIDKMSEVMKFISDNTWLVTALAAAFVAVKTAMFLEGAISAFSAVMGAAVSIGSASAAAVSGAWKLAAGTVATTWKGLAALVATPMVMPAIVVAAAIASIWKVRTEIDNLNRAIDGANERIRSRDINEYMRVYNEIKEKRGIEAAHRFRDSQSRHTGGPVSRGEAYVVGERRPEVFVPNTSGRIDPQPATGTEVHNNLYGTFNFYTAESVDRFFERLDKTQRLARMGMAA